MSRVDYCNLLLAGAPKSVTDKLQHVMNAAAWVVSGTKKYDHSLTHLLHSELHWLNVADRVTYKLGVTVYKCLHGQAPDYLSELCTLVAQVASSFRQPPSTRCSAISARYVRPSHLRCRWTNDMELVRKQFLRAEHANWLFSSYTEDVSFSSVLGTLSALEALFATMRYINWHLHLHLHGLLKTKQFRAMVSTDEALHGIFKEPILGPIKFKMSDGRHSAINIVQSCIIYE